MGISKRLLTTAALLGMAGAAWAQTAPAPEAPNSSASLNLPQTVTVFGRPIPSVIKASAIVNGEVITQTDIDHRLALLAIANNQPIPKEEEERLRVQVLRNLIDETLQIQEIGRAHV